MNETLTTPHTHNTRSTRISTRTSPAFSLARGLCVATALGLVAASGAAEQIAYEGFAYGSTPNIAFANGGTGWGGPWFKLSSIPTGATTEGLAWPGLPTSGGSAFTAPYASADYTRYSRVLAPYAAPGDTVYLSFLFRPNAGFGVGGGIAFGTWENGMIVGLAPGTGHYGLAGFQGPSSVSSVTPSTGTTVLLVARATRNADATITWALHVNPPIAGGEPASPAATMTIPGSTLPQAAVLYNDGGFSTDEIRFGTTWASVLGPPETPCLGDLDGDSTVGPADLALLLGQWGTQGASDLNGDGSVDAADLALLLGAWGPCPS